MDSAKIGLVGRMIDLLGRFQRSDARLEVYSHQSADHAHNTYPSQAYVDDVFELGKELNTIARELPTFLPNAESSVRKLEADAMDVVKHAGHMQQMAYNESSFGDGWGKVFDTVVSDLRAATDAVLKSDDQPPAEVFETDGPMRESEPHKVTLGSVRPASDS